MVISLKRNSTFVEAAQFCNCCILFSGLSAPPVTCPYRAEQATGLAGGYDSLVLAGLCSRLGVCNGIQLLVAEIERHVNRDFDEIQHVEEEAQVEQESAAPAGDLNDLSDDAAGIADEQENLKEQALALGGAGNDGFADGNRPGQTETEDGQCFQ